jgi:hypothetical protein
MPIALDQPAEKIVDIAGGTGTDRTSSLTANDDTGMMDLFYGLWACVRDTSDIYVARSVDGP